MAKQDNSKILLYGGGLLIVYFGILRPLLEKLGLATSQAEQQVINQQNLPNNKNNMPNWLTTLINLSVIATMILGTIYIFNLI